VLENVTDEGVLGMDAATEEGGPMMFTMGGAGAAGALAAGI